MRIIKNPSYNSEVKVIIIPDNYRYRYGISLESSLFTLIYTLTDDDDPDYNRLDPELFSYALGLSGGPSPNPGQDKDKHCGSESGLSRGGGGREKERLQKKFKKVKTCPCKSYYSNEFLP
jgi:hypothetical protein